MAGKDFGGVMYLRDSNGANLSIRGNFSVMRPKFTSCHPKRPCDWGGQVVLQCILRSGACTPQAGKPRRSICP